MSLTRVSLTRWMRVCVAVGTVGVVTLAGTVASGASTLQPADRQPPSGGQPGGPGGPGGQGGRGRGEGMSVEGAMKMLNRGVRQLRGQVTDASKRDENLKIIGDLERAALSAKSAGAPQGVLMDAKDDAAKAKVNNTYRKDLMTAVRTMLDIEQDIVDGKGDAAKSKLDSLMALRDSSHGELGVKADSPPGGDMLPPSGGRGRGGEGAKPSDEKPKEEKPK